MAKSIAEVNSARALRGLSGNGLDPYPIETGDPVIVPPEDLHTLGTPQQQRTILQTFSTSEESSSFHSNVTKVGWSVSVGMEANFSIGSVSAESKYSQEDSHKRTEEFSKQVNKKVVSEISYVPRASFRISRPQMALSTEALQDAAHVSDTETAIRFLHKYKSHVSSTTYTVGGIFIRESEVSSTKTHKSSVLTIKGMKSLKLEAEASVFMAKMKASGEFSKEDEDEVSKTNSSDIESSEERTQVWGPTDAHDFNDFLGRLGADPSEWVIIDKDIEKGDELVGIWEIMKEHKELESAAILVCESWQDMVWNFREKDQLIKQLFDLSKDTFDRDGLLPWEDAASQKSIPAPWSRMFGHPLTADNLISTCADINVLSPDSVDSSALAPLFVYAGNILLDKPLGAKPSLHNQAAEDFIDYLRHRLIKLSKDSDEEDSDWSDSELEPQSFDHDLLGVLTYVMNSSDLQSRVALSTLLLQRRSAVPLVTWTGGEESATLRHSADILYLTEADLGDKLQMVSLVESTDLPRVAFISEVSDPSAVDIPSNLLGCEFYAKSSTLRTPTVQVGVGFIADANSGPYHACIALLVLGDYRGENGQLLQFLQDTNAAIVLGTQGRGSTPDKFKGFPYFMQWELLIQGENKTDKQTRKISGDREYVKAKLSKHLANFIMNYKSQRMASNCNKTLRETCSDHFPANIGILLPEEFKLFDWDNLRANLKLQQSFEAESKLEFEIMDLINDPSSKHAVELKRDEVQKQRYDMVKEVATLPMPIIQAFYGVLKIKESLQRNAGVMVLQKEIVRHTKGLLGTANLWREMCHIHVLANHRLDPTPGALAAQHVMDGFPLEILDGDAGMVCLPWVEDVLAQIEKLATVNRKLTRAPKVFVVSALGLPNCGKSTLLNTMFGPTRAAEQHTSTRGVSIQMIPVDQRSEYDYVLLVDTDRQGLGSPKDDVLHVNRLATFCMLLSDVCLWMLPDEDDIQGGNRLKEILQMVMLAYKGSVLQVKSYGGSPIRTKLMFVQQGVDVSDTGKLKAKSEDLYKFVKDGDVMVANLGYPDTTSVDPSTIIPELKVSADQDQSDVKLFGNPNMVDPSKIIPELKVSADQDQSDVKFLGNHKMGQVPPADTRSAGYGEAVMKIREYMHTRVTQEPGYEAMTLTTWNQHLTRVWQSINNANFELSFKSIDEYSSWRKDTENVITKFYTQLDAEYLTVFEKNISSKANFNFDATWADLEARFAEVLEPIHQKVAHSLKGSRWKAQEEDGWMDFCDGLTQEYKLRLDEVANDSFDIDRRGLEILKHRMRIQIRELEDNVNFDVNKEGTFHDLFNSLIIKHSSVFLKRIKDQVEKIYQRYQSVSRRLDLFDESAVEELDCNLQAKIKFLLKSHTFGIEQYSTKVVLDVITDTQDSLWGYSRSQEQAAHRWMMSALIDEMKARQTKWSNNRNRLPHKLEKEKESLWKVFNGCLEARSLYKQLMPFFESIASVRDINGLFKQAFGFGIQRFFEKEGAKSIEHRSVVRFEQELEDSIAEALRIHEVRNSNEQLTIKDLELFQNVWDSTHLLQSISSKGELDADFNLTYIPLLCADLRKILI